MPQNQNRPLQKPPLESIREQYGADEARRAFFRLYSENTQKAVQQLNDEKLTFATLYALRPEISKQSLHSSLNSRGAVALTLADHLLKQTPTTAFKYKSEEYPVLLWMFLTGCKELHLGDDYDALMDLAALLLLFEYNDQTCLKPLEELIFERHRLEHYTYDAEWAFFGCGNAQCIAMASERLLSQNPRDIQHARRLLRFIPCFDDPEAKPAAQYRCVQRWLEENKAYLAYTGESSQKSFNPCRYRVSLWQKYLQSAARTATEAMTEPERLLETRFRQLDKKTQEDLSGYSHRLRRQNPAKWQRWMQSPFTDQVRQAMNVARRQNGHHQ